MELQMVNSKFFPPKLRSCSPFSPNFYCHIFYYTVLGSVTVAIVYKVSTIVDKLLLTSHLVFSISFVDDNIHYIVDWTVLMCPLLC